MELEEFHRDFFQEVHWAGDADERFVEDAFFEIFCSHLIETGELDTADRAAYFSPQGMRVDGYAGDPDLAGGVLTLIIADFQQKSEVSTLTGSEMTRIFNRASKFLNQSLSSSFRRRLEETSPAFGLAHLISTRWDKIVKVRLILISNRVLSSRVDGREAEELGGVPITYSVWDIGRLFRFVASGQAMEDIEVDLQSDFGGALQALPAHLGEASYESYLVVIPGSVLAAVYDRWGARLLEQNVRVFLQAKGKVNKGIRITLENDPEMFFAYNNGITATAEGIDTIAQNGTMSITKIRNLQIVNGGQTTASIHVFSRKKDVSLDRVFVQMKLSIVDAESAPQVVPKISEYANSQNRVNAADFFANHPFHVRMESFSRRIYAPSPDGSFRESKWFYERARGQYLDARARRTVAERKRFDLEYPKSQVCTKTDLAKFCMVWDGLPHIVSKGAQKNFGEFAGEIGKRWDKKSDSFNESFYRQSIAMAMIFRKAEKIVSAQPWYQGGYRANIVAYAIAKLGHAVMERKLSVDFESVWKRGVSDAFVDALTICGKKVNDVISKPDAGVRNVTEWAKKQPCWARVMRLDVSLPGPWLGELVGQDEVRSEARAAVKEQKVLNGIEAQTAVFSAGGEVWRNLLEWGVERRLLSPKEQSVLKVASGVPGKVPTDKQSLLIIKILQNLHEEGCQLGIDVV